MNIYVQIFIWTYVFISLGIQVDVEWLGLMVSLCVAF